MTLSLPPKFMVFFTFIPPLNVNVLLCRLFFNLNLCLTKLRVLVLCFSYFTHNSIKWKKQRNSRHWLLSRVWTKLQQSKLNQNECFNHTLPFVNCEPTINRDVYDGSQTFRACSGHQLEAELMPIIGPCITWPSIGPQISPLLAWNLHKIGPQRCLGFQMYVRS